MNNSIRRGCAALLAAAILGAAVPTPAVAQKKSAAVPDPMVGQLMVKLRNPSASERVQALGASRMTALSAAAGVSLKSVRAMSGDATVVRLPRAMPLSQARAVAARLAGDASVDWAEPDLPVRRQQVTPPDQGYPVLQWNLFPPNQPFVVNVLGGGQRQYTTTGGANLSPAWGRTLGSDSIVVAVIDTGISFGHTDLQGQVLQGYDFISSDALTTSPVGDAPTNFVANDGDGRDADATDPGDWVTTSEEGLYPNACAGTAGSSSWHGTHMAGIVAALWGDNIDPSTGLPRNGTRLAGMAPNVFILPARALGKCGGVSSDVIDAMRWAAGLPVPGVPTNPNRARVINLSLGGTGGQCTTYSQAVSDVLATGAVVVAAAGNEGVASVLQPANCAGVVGVAAHAINGDSSDFSNVGPEVAISAPGGGEATQLAGSPTNASRDDAFFVWSTGLFGPTTPTSFDTSTNPPRDGPALLGLTGTSPATAHVSAAAALLLSINPTLTAAQVRAILQNTARPHPAGGYCAQGQPGAGLCGEGLLDVGAAVASIAPSPASGGGGGSLPPWTLVLLAALLLARELRRRPRAA